ncbi:SAYSvFN domain-containing protein 1 [Equus asinus]|uniref:SAYSVFN motif domain containing 1 n=4 Tax=Equus TaxID=9789 RepID=F6TCT3_HORSE|nr:SAYSvFN domain-containing protein 1 [Equus caballus]XP_008516238.1 PREDICTED: SAYSvFN domain-containing protein 1 [Equus przewalskii]XP_014686499.1 SAYSvFN domain-containing protein 1 [Equus asinus]
MEQRLAEFREARKRAGQAAEPSPSRQSAQTSGEKAEAAATPRAASGWLKRFLGWKPRPASAQTQPSVAQEAAQPGSSTSQPPRNTAIPLPSPRDQSILTNITFLKVLLWLVLLGLFVELEFGLAYFVLSLFYWMYVGTRGPGEKKAGEKSAYSVFNPGCEAIQGTLTAEQFERELQFRPLEGR